MAPSWVVFVAFSRFKMSPLKNLISTRIIIVIGFIVHLCFSILLNPPKIRIGFLCSTNVADYNTVNLQCTYRQGLLKSKPFLDLIEHNHTFYFDDQSQSPLFLALICVAPYPVKWNHFQEQWLRDIAGDNWLHVMALQFTHSQRIINNIDEPATYRYASFKVITNHITSDSNYALGEYTCDELKKSGSLVKSTKMTTPVKFEVYRKMSIYDSVFPLSKKNVTLYMEDKREEDGSIVIPCHVSSPGTKATLYRKKVKEISAKRNAIFIHPDGKPSHHKSDNKIEESWELIPETTNLRFRPQLGFVYVDENVAPNNPRQFHLAPGTYKCTADYQSGTNTPPSTDEGEQNVDKDWVIIQVVPGHKKVESHLSFINPPASFNVTLVDNYQFFVTCCSRSATPPSLLSAKCLSRERCYRRIENSDIPSTTYGVGMNRLSEVKGNCVETVPIDFPATLIIPRVFRCIGDGIDYKTTIIFPVDGMAQRNKTPKLLPTPYRDWKDVDPFRMIVLRSKTGDSFFTNESLVFYENQNATFQCYASVAYFALGVRATINFSNGTRELVPEKKTPEEHFLTLFQGDAQIEFAYTLTSSVESISCFAPMIDSAEWIEKTIKIMLKKGEMVSIRGSEQEVISWVLNDTNKEFTCEFGGMPTPTIVSWMKNGQLINSTQNTTEGDKSHVPSNYIIRTLSSNTSVLHVGVVDYETHGTYECIVKNVLGEAKKSFQVFVIFSDQTWLIMCVLIGAAFLITVFVLMGTKTWKQRQKLIHLTNPFEFHNDLMKLF